MKHILALLLIVISFSGCKKTIEELLENDRSVGSSAKDLLSASKYTSLKVNIQYMPGYAPDQGALNHLHTFLTNILNKPGGITITTKEIPAAANTTLAVEDVHAIEKANRTGSNTSNEINVYILYTNGNYTNAEVLGIAYKNTSAALFGKKIHDNSGGVGQVSRTKLEATVLEHEMGHILGLVNIGSPMQTPHSMHGNHCDNQFCLMYYASETMDILGILLTGNVPMLDVNCLDDLRANGGK